MHIFIQRFIIIFSSIIDGGFDNDRIFSPHKEILPILPCLKKMYYDEIQDEVEFKKLFAFLGVSL